MRCLKNSLLSGFIALSIVAIFTVGCGGELIGGQTDQDQLEAFGNKAAYPWDNMGQVPFHSADVLGRWFNKTVGDWKIELSELLRMVQFFNSDGYSCDPCTCDSRANEDCANDALVPSVLEEQGCAGGIASEDGYKAGPGNTAICAPHSADTTEDFSVNLSELLRVIQFFNSEGYHLQEGTEDGYAAGVSNYGLSLVSVDAQSLTMELKDKNNFGTPSLGFENGTPLWLQTYYVGQSYQEIDLGGHSGIPAQTKEVTINADHSRQGRRFCDSGYDKEKVMLYLRAGANGAKKATEDYGVYVCCDKFEHTVQGVCLNISATGWNNAVCLGPYEKACTPLQ